MERNLSIKDLCIITASLEAHKEDLQESANKLMAKSGESKRKPHDRNAIMKQAFERMRRANELGDTLRKVDHNLTVQKANEAMHAQMSFHMALMSRFSRPRFGAITCPPSHMGLTELLETIFKA